MNTFPKLPSGAPLHTLSKLYDVPLVLYNPSFEAVPCFVCGRRRMAVIQHQMICLVLVLNITSNAPLILLNTPERNH